MVFGTALAGNNMRKYSQKLLWEDEGQPGLRHHLHQGDISSKSRVEAEAANCGLRVEEKQVRVPRYLAPGRTSRLAHTRYQGAPSYLCCMLGGKLCDLECLRVAG